MTKLEIEIQIRKPLKPSTPTPNHLQTFNLSLLDQMTSRMYVPLLFYYFPSSELIKAENNTERCDKLQKSLAETLAKFYPLAGRCRKDRLSIHCNDEGVEYVEAKVNADLTNFLHDGPKIELLDDLLPWPVPPESYLPSSPLLGVQVNLFNCGGLVIATQISHILADAFSMATFLNEWAHNSLTGKTKGCFQSLDHLSSLFPARVLEEHQFPPPPSRGANIVARRFVFDVLSIAKLQNRIHSGATFMKPSRVLLVMSLIWKVLVGISSARHGRSRDSCSIIAMNMRGKSNIPSSENALGNFCSAAVATLQANQSNDFNDFVNLLRSTSKEKSVGIGKASIDDITSLLLYRDTRVVHNPCQKDDVDTYVFSSWCRFPWYEVDFGWGKPFWVSTVGFPSGVVILIDTKNGDGIEAWVNLKENDMAEFEGHPELLTFCHLHSIP